MTASYRQKSNFTSRRLLVLLKDTASQKKADSWKTQGKDEEGTPPLSSKKKIEEKRSTPDVLWWKGEGIKLHLGRYDVQSNKKIHNGDKKHLEDSYFGDWILQQR